MTIDKIYERLDQILNKKFSLQLTYVTEIDRIPIGIRERFFFTTSDASKI